MQSRFCKNKYWEFQREKIKFTSSHLFSLIKIQDPYKGLSLQQRTTLSILFLDLIVYGFLASTEESDVWYPIDMWRCYHT